MANKTMAYLRELADKARRRSESRVLYKRLDKCEDELSLETEKFGIACFEGEGDEALRRSVETLREEADTLRKKMDELAGILRCPDCHLAMDAGDAFCRQCGRALKKTGSAQIVWPEE